MKKFNLIIIGAGASGLMCALKSKEKNIALIDANSKPGKKILVTGNGRCNLTNMCIEAKNYNQDIEKYLSRFNQTQTLNYFSSLGLETFADEEGRVYPISNSAKSVVDVILNKLENKVEFILNQKVVKVEKQNEEFIVSTEQDKYYCKKLVIATGGKSAEEIIKSFNISCKSFTPSLVALKSNAIKDLNGVKVSSVLVKATNFNGETKEEVGEVLFKDNGISGIVIFNLSSIFARTNCFKGKITIDLLPNLTNKELFNKLEKRKDLCVNIDKFFTGFFIPALANEIFKQAKINTNSNSKNLTNQQLEKLVFTIKNLTFSVDGYYDNNQIHSGGVLLSELTQNLMSKQVKNLYFIGEVCDVDGVCGGFNLQWAWTSGAIVGESL